MTLKSDLNFDLKQLRSFLCILDEGSFTRASRALKIGQSTISHQINSLEEILGVRLIDRTTKEVTVTAEGNIFRGFCEKLFENVEGLRLELASGMPGTAVRVAASSIPASYILPELIAGIRENHPECRYSVEAGNSREAIEQVKEGKAEAGVVGKIVKHPSLVYDHVFSDEIVLIGGPGSPDRMKPGDLPDHPFISRERGSGTRDACEKALLSCHIRPSEMNTVFECTSSEMVKRAVMAGMGIAFLSGLAIGSEVKQGSLKVIRVEDLKILRDFYAVYPPRRLMSKQALIFIDELGRFKKRKGK